MKMQMSSRSRVSLSVIALFGLAVASPADAQSLSRNPNAPTVSTGSVRPTLPLNAVSITQSASLVPVAGAIACANTGLHTDNSYWRAFSLSSFPALDSTFFVVESVDIGVETANASGTGTTQPITLRLYSQSGAAFPGGVQTLLATENIQIADQALTFVNIPLTTPVPLLNASAVLVVELFTPRRGAAASLPAKSCWAVGPELHHGGRLRHRHAHGPRRNRLSQHAPRHAGQRTEPAAPGRASELHDRLVLLPPPLSEPLRRADGIRGGHERSCGQAGSIELKRC
ncbi:MAG: hypothetical protein IPP07_15265 [Holophagales bacterium]|nr:hypothetical protein [Holophagales bacterium]